MGSGIWDLNNLIKFCFKIFFLETALISRYLVDISVSWEKVGFLHKFAAMIIADPIITILH